MFHQNLSCGSDTCWQKHVRRDKSIIRTRLKTRNFEFSTGDNEEYLLLEYGDMLSGCIYGTFQRYVLPSTSPTTTEQHVNLKRI